MIEACARCGAPYSYLAHETICVHNVDLVKVMDREHAVRIQAAHALGKRLNLDHDETNYYAQTLDAVAVTDFKERARSTGEGSSSSSAAFTATVGGAMEASPPSSTNQLTNT
jgi:hypothetical protein